MRNTNEIILALAICAGRAARDAAMNFAGLMVDAQDALTEMQDRCARYAEEIMLLRQQLEEVRHD